MEDVFNMNDISYYEILKLNNRNKNKTFHVTPRLGVKLYSHRMLFLSHANIFLHWYREADKCLRWLIAARLKQLIF